MRIGRTAMTAQFCPVGAISNRDMIERHLADFGAIFERPRRAFETMRTRFGPDRVFGFSLRLFGYRAALLIRTDPDGAKDYTAGLFPPGFLNPVNVAKREAYLDRLVAEEAEIARLAPSEDTLEGA